MKVTDFGATAVAAVTFFLLACVGFLGVAAGVQLLADTNRLIYALLALVSAYLTVIFLQCTAKFIDKL